jgi:glutamate N-acetyltransferase/amino-acid N-acetyltransferase
MADGGVCAANGFRANGVHCGIKNTKKDLALIASDVPASAAAVFTKNIVQAAPIAVSRANLKNGVAQAVIANSGNANACCAGGEGTAREMCECAAKALGISPEDVLVASTGVIGKTLDSAPIVAAMPGLAKGMGAKSSEAAIAIMTTDTFCKEAAAKFELGGKTVHIGGIAKGSGMIHPNMATMLVFITSDASIDSGLLGEILAEDVTDSFNMITVDGDTSTNDMCAVLANGMSGAEPIERGSEGEEAFREALSSVTKRLCKMIATDGEGATKFITVKVRGATSKQDARAVARSIAGSSLVKAAVRGEDANWGRVLAAAGYSGAEFQVHNAQIAFSSKYGEVAVCSEGVSLPFSEEDAAKILSAKEIGILVGLGSGTFEAEAWGCDLTEEYVKINADYRS